MASLAERVAFRFWKRVARGEGKSLGRDCRLTWSDHGWKLEELPVKGVKKLRVANLDNPGSRGWANFDAFIPENILRDAQLSPSDQYDTIKFKLIVAYRSAAETVIAKMDPDRADKSDWLRQMDWYESVVHYLKVSPENTAEFIAEGADFKMSVSWTDFSATYSYGGGGGHDESYTQYSASSPTAARKLYQMLVANPKALQSISWDELSTFLRANKIQYKSHMSQYR